MCQFPEMEDADAIGVWQVVTGIDGQTEETKFEVNVEPKGITLSVCEIENGYFVQKI